MCPPGYECNRRGHRTRADTWVRSYQTVPRRGRALCALEWLVPLLQAFLELGGGVFGRDLVAEDALH